MSGKDLHEYLKVPHHETGEVVEDPEHNALPQPECFQILDRIRAAKKNSTGPRAFLLKVLCGPAFLIACEFITLLVDIAHIIIGIVFYDSCTIESKIPVWLIVNGISNIALNLALGATSIDNYVNRKNPHVARRQKILSLITILVFGLSAIWLILGNYWLYSVYDQVQYDPLLDPATYCHEYAYIFALWVIIVTWICIICFVCSCICNQLCSGPKDDPEKDEVLRRL